MITRRRFIQHSSLASLTIGLKNIPPWLVTQKEGFFTYQSDYLKLSLLKERPQFNFFSTDSLGGGRFNTNPLLEEEKEHSVSYLSSVNGNDIAYYTNETDKQTPAWQFKCQPDKIIISTEWSPGQEQVMPVEINFSQVANHCTVLGRMEDTGRMAFPCLLHFPGMGSFRLYCSDPAVTLFYDADRDVKEPFVKIILQAAGADHPHISYQFESVAIYPQETDKIKTDPRFDGFRRNFINIFQVNPRIMALANNSASDTCAFTLFLYAEMAMHTPELVKGLTAPDLLRNSLDRYLEGMKAYGQVGYKNGAAWHSEFDSSDSAPSLVISACNYILHTKDMSWAVKNYSGIKDWAVKMLSTDHNQDGIIEYGYSGNSGSWDGVKRPANWWDTIGFGHDDAYSNALAYHACRLISRVAVWLGKQEDGMDFTNFGDKLKTNYYPNFYNKQTGVLAGWKSADGELHDYYFTFVNSIAICYGLVEGEQADLIMNNLLNKMKEVGYTNFSLGLPGNLIPVSKEDYTDFNKRFGYDSFQVYENGGATACYSYFTLKALFKLNRRKEAESIFLPMLESFKNGGFEGNCPGSDMTKDWKTWTGACWGYEGFLVDNYLTLLAALDYLQKTD